MMRSPRPGDKRDFGERLANASGPNPNSLKQGQFRLRCLHSESLRFFLQGMTFSRSLRFLIWTALGLVCPTLSSHAAARLSPLAPTPDWTALSAYDKTITRQEFSRLINQVYSNDGAFWAYADINDKRVIVFSDTAKTHPLLTLNFASSESTEAPLPYHYKTQATSHDPARPLQGIRIALDPGHIGGDWAKLEARYFKLGDDPPVEEAKLNFITCELLAERLQADGAEIIWAKRGYDPVTHLRPDDLHREAIAALALHNNPNSSVSGYTPSFLFGLPLPHAIRNGNKGVSESRIDNEAALLFYRVAEIRARGDVVNKQHPDLTICVHYNADEWGNPDHPTLTERSHLVIFTNGAYEKSELAYDDYKYDMLRKLLDRTAVQEERGCALVGQAMLDKLKYPPENYPGSYFAHRVTDVPSVYARDLLANRIYHGPVIYCEGPYMNARDAYYRIIAGDYLGLRVVQGESVPSIYRDYAAAVEQGVLKYFGVK
jgi:N-acetylmuramoyl-L-alanine amidase